ncbi:hypothetical protein C0992_002253 [Termitomyces sp. T32_za158]|nr:hypothetical protein C0992_002253 [Termitomyces sp. T32_za158]
MFSAIKRHLNFREFLRHGRRSENEDMEPRPLLDHCALAHKLYNYDQDRFPVTQYDVNIDQKFQVDAFKSALRVPEGADFTNFTFQLGHEYPDAEEGTLVPTIEESDLMTLGELDYTSSNSKTLKPVDLFSFEEIFADESEILPALLIRYTDIIGSDRLVYKHDAAIYYDFCVDQIERHVSSRGVMALPRIPDHDFFCRHAVRVFLQVPDIPNIVDGPFYRYMGDCYIVKTNQLLSRHEWIALPDFLKERFVTRFIETQNTVPRDGFRAQNHYTRATARELLDHGNIYPYIFLMQAWYKEETLELYSPVRLNGTEMPFVTPASPKSCKSASIYSQESAPCDDGEYACPFYSSADIVDNLPSPLLFTDPFGGGSHVIITFPSGQQEIYTASRAAFAYNPEDYDVDEEQSIDRSNNEDQYMGNDYNASDFGDEGGDSPKVQDTQGTAGDTEAPSHWFENEEMDEDDEDGMADTKHEISDSDRARYAALKVFCEELEETSRSDTAMGRVQRQFIQNMRAEMAALGLWDDTNPEIGDGNGHAF